MTRRREQAPQGGRRSAREFAFRVLFESAQGDTTIEQTYERAVRGMNLGNDAYPQLNEDALAFARELAFGYAEHSDRVDALLRDTIQGWSFSQMAQTDLNILRVAAFEMTSGTDEPAAPVIESAVRIARKFGGDDSGRFVNGVLASLARKLDAGRARQ